MYGSALLAALVYISRARHPATNDTSGTFGHYL
jgi:hypothetical protein